MTRLDLILWFLAGWFIASIIAAAAWGFCRRRAEQVRGDTQSHNGSNAL